VRFIEVRGARLPKLWVCTFPHPEHNAASALASAAALFRASYGTERCPTVADPKRDVFLSDDRITEDDIRSRKPR